MDDSDRYRERLQKSLLSEGWEKAFDYKALKEWVVSNRDMLKASARATLGRAEPEDEAFFARVVENFTPKSNYDLPMTEEIFGSLFRSVEKSAHRIGISPTRNIELVTSTSISPGPYAYPTDGTHYLFVGLGSSVFCNYWAKAYTSIIRAIATSECPDKRITTCEQLRHCIRHDLSGLLLAARLALYFAATQTLIGFGEAVQPLDHLAYRVELLKAMETFAISHEYAHFVAHERELKFDEPSETNLEFFCDTLGLQICREWANENDSWLAFNGIGALAFFHAVHVCQACREVLAGEGNGERSSGRIQRDLGQGTHPPLNERVSKLVVNVVERTCEDQKAQVTSFLTEYDLILSSINRFILECL